MREPIQVVFDPGPQSGVARSLGGGGISVRFAPRGATADSVIIRQLRQDAAPQHHTVVSSDNEVRNVARALGATLLSSQEFAARLAARPARRGTGVTRKRDNGEKPGNLDVDFWMQQFKRKRK
jgi:predicted RNA-binding protein with PIN domain